MAGAGNNRCFETRAWSGVEDGSTLELSVSDAGGQGRFTATGRMLDGFNQEIWPEGEIRPGPRSHPLTSGRAFFVTATVSFWASAPQQESANVEFRIRRPDGSTRQPVYSWAVTKGDCSTPDQVRGVWVTMAPGGGL